MTPKRQMKLVVSLTDYHDRSARIARKMLKICKSRPGKKYWLRTAKMHQDFYDLLVAMTS